MPRPEAIALAERWASDPRSAIPDPEPAAWFIGELHQLATTAKEQGQHVYCWVCP